MAEEEDFTQLPLPAQFAHKNWKARKNGYETAAKEFKVAPPNSPLVREFLLDSGLWKGAVSDSNVAAQQEALSAYTAFLDAAGPDGARRTRGSTIGPVVEKGLLGRPAAKASALEALLLLIELDKADPVIEELLPFLAHKQPKVVAATLSALTNIYHAYGCKTVEPKPVLKVLPKAFGHADKNVRAEAQNLTVELYRWLREAMKPLFWGELKEVQQKDLDKLFEPVKAEPNPKQERLLRSQQAIQEQAAEAAAAADVEDEEGEDAQIDLEPEYEAVDALAKVPKDFNERLNSSKWKDRKEALDETFAAVNVPAIKEGSYDDVLRGCAKSMKDANIAVVTVAANCIEAIAKGLRRAFARYRSTVLAAMLERFKEKKVAVTDAIAAACDAVFAATGLAEIQPDALEALKNKNPSVKEHTAKFIARSLRSTREVPTPEQTKEFAEAGKKLLGEGAAPLRDAGADILGTLWKILTDRNMLSHLDGLDDLKKAKVKEFCDAAEVKAKWRPKTIAPAPRAAAAGPGAGRKPALGGKRPAPAAAKKAPAPRAASPPFIEEPASQPRPTARPVAKAAGALKPPGSGLKAPGSALQRPGLKTPQVVTSSTASPKRQSMMVEDFAPTTPVKSSIAPPGRGLTGRPLGKPAAATASPPPTQRSHDPASTALSSIERQELTDLRQEVDLVRQQASDLRTDKMRLSSQVAELQVQNAQLIEDHTRDVLQIKAKETQLVRARSDAESAEDRANSLSKEIDRLKREISRLGRAQAGRDSPVDGALMGNGYAPNRGAYPTPTSYPARPHAGSIDSAGYGEGKENLLDAASHPVVARKLNGLATVGSGHEYSRAPPHSRPMSNTSSRASEEYGAAGGTTSSGANSASAAGLNRSQGEGVESWKRAAEVTQNLKARIEMMKARQNLGRGS